MSAYVFVPTVDGPDLVVKGAVATWFGGDHDPDDNGETASGVMTKGNPDILGCALPMKGFRATRESPLPKLPWKTKVVVCNRKTDKSVVVELIDLGPSPYLKSGASIDLTIAAFEALGVPHRMGDQTVDFRIMDGAKYL